MLQLTEHHAIASPRFLMKIDRNIISSLHIVCTDFTNIIKVEVDVNEMSLLNIQHENIRETIDSFVRGPYYHLFKRYVFILLIKIRTETKTVPSTKHIFDVSRSHHINLPP